MNNPIEKKETRGRKSLYSPAMKKAAEDYIENYESYGHVMPSAVGMSIVLKVVKSTLYEWAKDEEKGFSNTLARCSDYQEFVLLNKGLSGAFNATIVKLALANHGYADRADNTISGPNGESIKVDHSIFEFVPVGPTDG